VRFFEFLKEKFIYLLSLLIVDALSITIICALNPVGGAALAALIGLLVIIGAFIPLVIEYITKKDFYSNLLNIFESLDKKNLIAEMINLPSFKEGMILYDVVKRSNKAMLEEINKYRFMQEEYREYIELWIHEIKTPISSSRLIIQNNRSMPMDSIDEEFDRVEAFVEQVLYYSRSNNVEKDYFIKEIILKNLCFDILKKNSKLFIQNRISVVTDFADENVYSDAKWLEFIINQIIFNSIKYSKGPEAIVNISSINAENKIILKIEDNGIGVRESELPRIFEKGFTGTSGRMNSKATGMGLYICKKLCDKLGLSIYAESEYGKGTEISIIFPKSSMMEVR